MVFRSELALLTVSELAMKIHPSDLIFDANRDSDPIDMTSPTRKFPETLKSFANARGPMIDSVFIWGEQTCVPTDSQLFIIPPPSVDADPLVVHAPCTSRDDPKAPDLVTESVLQNVWQPDETPEGSMHKPCTEQVDPTTKEPKEEIQSPNILESPTVKRSCTINRSRIDTTFSISTFPCMEEVPAIRGPCAEHDWPTNASLRKEALLPKVDLPAIDNDAIEAVFVDSAPITAEPLTDIPLCMQLIPCMWVSEPQWIVEATEADEPATRPFTTDRDLIDPTSKLCLIDADPCTCRVELKTAEFAQSPSAHERVLLNETAPPA
jgi:hypothetical protein